MFVIPAIDLRGGTCVRLEQGDFDRATIVASHPIEVARRFADHGATWLHVVDLDGAKNGAPRHLDVLHDIASHTSLHIEFGGGLRDFDTVERALNNGAARVVLGTAAIENLDLLERACTVFGDRIVLGIDARDGMVATRGWLETTSTWALNLAKTAVLRGAMRIIYTDIATDGMLTGPNIAGLIAMIEGSGVPVVASGGVATEDHLRSIAATGAEATIVGKALYSGALPVGILAHWAAPSVPC
jgi:phosphoribosylformimino-5-aminoimidazole carboxamide ribotide isomerase